MNGQQILTALKSDGLSFTDIGRAIGVSRGHVRGVAHRTHDSIRVAQALALAIGKPVDKVFPDKPTYHRKPIDPKQREQRINEIKQQFGQVASA
ncbi:MAG: helix-turn-helix domain-containing protein [Candidatus Sedimenticola sp. (ex Thyasira tokunagai)]